MRACRSIPFSPPSPGEDRALRTLSFALLYVGKHGDVRDVHQYSYLASHRTSCSGSRIDDV